MWLFIIYNLYRIWYLVEVAEYEGLVLSHYCLQILVVVEVYSIILIIFVPHGPWPIKLSMYSGMAHGCANFVLGVVPLFTNLRFRAQIDDCEIAFA